MVVALVPPPEEAEVTEAEVAVALDPGEAFEPELLEMVDEPLGGAVPPLEENP